MLPHDVYPGQRMRVTLLKGVWGWAGNERTLVNPPGTVYEGIAGAVDAETFFDLQLEDGSLARFSTYDSGITVESISNG
jgi:hypothetical protein